MSFYSEMYLSQGPQISIYFSKEQSSDCILFKVNGANIYKRAIENKCMMCNVIIK